MKLKGKNLQKISKEKRIKMEKTLKRIQETREKDSRNLRDLLTAKLAWAVKEKEKGLKLIQDNQKQIYKLEGIILLAEDLLAPKKEEEKT